MNSKKIFKAGLAAAVAAAAFADTTVETGTQTIDGFGGTVDLGAVTVGTKNVEDSPTLILTNGTFTSGSDMHLQRGNGSKAAPQVSTVRVEAGADLTVANLYTGHYNGNTSHYSSSRLVVDGGRMTVGTARTNKALNNGMTFHSANNGNAVIEVKNGGEFYDDAVYYAQSGVKMGNAYNVDSTPRMEVTNGATAGMHGLLLRQGATVTVDRATFQLNRTMDQLYATEAMGDAFFNDARLTYYSNLLRFNCSNFANQVVEWFHGATVHVGPGGLELAIPGHARLEGRLAAAEGAEDSARVAVSGAGTLQADLFGTAVPVVPGADVTLKATRKIPSWTDSLGDVTVEQTAGRPFAVAGHGALAQGVLHPAAPCLTGRLEATAGNFVRDQWAIRDWAQIYDDGVAMMGQIGGYHAAAAWLKEKVDVTRSFTLSFVYSAVNVMNPANTQCGLMAVWQNSAKGTAAIGGNNNGMYGYFGGNTPIENSFAAGVQANGVYVFGKDQVQLGDKPSAGFTAAQLGATPDGRLYVTVRYDASAKTMSISSYLDATKSRTTATRTDVDLEEATGDTTAWFGFTGLSNFSTDGQQFVEGVSLVYDGEDAPGCMPHLGGTLALDAGLDYTIAVRGNSLQRGGVVGTLAYGDGAKLAIENEGIEENLSASIPSIAELPDSADESGWDFAGGAHGPTEDRHGPSTSTATAAGGFAAKTPLPVIGDWSLSFDLNYITAQATANAVDYIYFALSCSDDTYATDKYTQYLDLVFQHNPSSGNLYKNWFLRFNNANLPIVSGNLLENVSFIRDEPIRFDWSYSAAAKQITITLSQIVDGLVRTDTVVVAAGGSMTPSNFPDGVARFMCRSFGAETNRPKRWIENFAFTAPAIEAKAAVKNVAVGFDALVPAEPGATVEKLGEGSLVVAEPGSSAASVKLSAGDLVLKKTPVETVYADFDRGGWTFSDDTGAWGAHRGLKLNSTKPNNANTAVTVNRKAVSGDWRASFKINLEGQTVPADAICFFVQNADGGSHQVGNSNAHAAWTGKKGVAVGWTVYPPAGNYSRVDLANCRGFNYNSAEAEYFGGTLTLPDATTDVVLTYSASAHTLALSMSQGGAAFEKTWENVDIAAAVGGDLAYLGFGTGGGGAHARPEFVDFRFEQLSADDPTADMVWLGGIELTESSGAVVVDTPLAGSKVRVGSVAVPDGAVFKSASASARGVIAVDTLAGEDVAIDVSGADVKVGSLAPGVSNIRVKGAGSLVLPGGADFSGCDISLSDGARLSCDGRVVVHSISVDGVLNRQVRVTSRDAGWFEGEGLLRVVEPKAGMFIIAR